MKKKEILTLALLVAILPPAWAVASPYDVVRAWFPGGAHFPVAAEGFLYAFLAGRLGHRHAYL